MERDEDGGPGRGFGVEASGGDGDRPYAYWDGRVTDADFVDRPQEAPPLYDGRPVRDPYDRGGGYRRVSEAVWDRARNDYLDGDAAETVCARHGLALSTFRQRARAGGWRRIDRPDPEPVDLEAEAAAGLPDYAEMARHALVRLNRAVLGGRAAEAAGWMRLHIRLSDLARAADATPPPSPPPSPDPSPGPATPDPEPASRPPAEPAKTGKTPAPEALAAAKARTVHTLVRAVTALNPRDPTSRRLIEKSLEVLDALDRPPISYDSHHSDGVFPDAGSKTPDPPLDPPLAPP